MDYKEKEYLTYRELCTFPPSHWSKKDAILYFEAKKLEAENKIKELKTELSNIRYKGRTKRQNLRYMIKSKKDYIINLDKIIAIENDDNSEIKMGDLNVAEIPNN